jgi:hypothetical protein
MTLITIVAAGARHVLSDIDFPEAKRGTTTIAPHVLVNVNHGGYHISWSADTKTWRS